jgi:hypothetical protein
MTPLGANLRHLYQRKGMWLMFTLVTLMSLPTLMAIFPHIQRPEDMGRAWLAWPLLVVYTLGLFMADHVTTILVSPVSFFLPRQRNVTRQFLAIEIGRASCRERVSERV